VNKAIMSQQLEIEAVVTYIIDGQDHQFRLAQRRIARLRKAAFNPTKLTWFYAHPNQQRKFVLSALKLGRLQWELRRMKTEQSLDLPQFMASPKIVRMTQRMLKLAESIVILDHNGTFTSALGLRPPPIDPEVKKRIEQMKNRYNSVQKELAKAEKEGQRKGGRGRRGAKEGRRENCENVVFGSS